MKRAYKKGFVYDQMQFDYAFGDYKNIDPNICVGCACANAAQALLISQGVRVYGDYAKGIYERARSNAEDSEQSGLLIYLGVKETLRTFNLLLENRKIPRNLVAYRKDYAAENIEEHLLSHGPVTVGVNWTEGMMYPTPRIPAGTGFWRRMWHHLRSPRFCKADGAKMGFHAVAIIGVDTVARVFKLENSYGLGWGNKGQAYISYADLDRVVKEAWFFQLKHNSSK